MLVRYFMTRAVVTLPSTMSCAEAWALFQQEGLRRAPVMEARRVLGMVTDRDLIRLLPRTIADTERFATAGLSNAAVTACIGRALISVQPSDHLETVAALLLQHKIGGLPVIQDGLLQGIITESDLFRVFMQRQHDPGAVRLTLHAPERPGPYLDPSRVALACNLQMHEYVRHTAPGGGDLLLLRVVGPRVEDFIARLRADGYVLVDRLETASPLVAEGPSEPS